MELMKEISCFLHCSFPSKKKIFEALFFFLSNCGMHLLAQKKVSAQDLRSGSKRSGCPRPPPSSSYPFLT